MKYFYYIIIIFFFNSCTLTNNSGVYNNYLYQESLKTLEYSWHLQNITIPNHKIFDINNQPHLLYDFIPDSTVVLYLNYTMCPPCMLDNIQKLNNIHQTTGKNICIILTFPDPISAWESYSDIQELKCPILSIQHTLLKGIEISTPLFFIYQNRNINKPYLSSKGIDDFFYCYLKALV